MNITGKPPGDILPKIIQLDQEFFPEPWTPLQWETLNWDLYALFPWKDGENLLGFALFGIAPLDDTSHLFKILVHPTRQGTSGVAAYWLNITKELKKSGIQHIYLEVSSNNQKAIRFYTKQGFQLLRRNKSYYSSGDDALIMSLTL